MNMERHEYVAQFGAELGPAFHRLHDDFFTLVVNWQEYRKAFGKNPGRIELMNAAAGMFFRIAQDALWDDLLMRLCRLTDKEIVARKETLSIRALVQLVPATLKDDVARKVDHAVDQTAWARDVRNRRLAHTDRLLALQDARATPLPPETRRRFGDAVAAVHEVLSYINVRVTGSSIASMVLTRGDDAEDMLRVLKDGLAVQERRIEKLRNGEGYDPEPNIDADWEDFVDET